LDFRNSTAAYTGDLARIVGTGSTVGANSVGVLQFYTYTGSAVQLWWQMDQAGNLVQAPLLNPASGTGIVFNSAGANGYNIIREGVQNQSGWGGGNLFLEGGTANGGATGALNTGGSVYVFGGPPNTGGTYGNVILADNGSGVVGSVGIGTTNPTATLYVNGSTVLTQGYSQSSDARLKTDVATVKDGLSLVEQLRPVRFHWRAPGDRQVGKALDLPTDKPQVGFIAQEVEPVIPEAVTVPKGGSSDVYTLDESKLIPALVAAVKQQEEELKAEQAEIKALKAKVASLAAETSGAKK